MSNICIQLLFCLLILWFKTSAFIPFPLLADGGQTSDSITHAEITQSGFIRCLARFFYETRIQLNSNSKNAVNQQEYFAQNHTIDGLYKLAFPDYNRAQIELHSLPLKFILDSIMTHNALVDFDSDTQKLSAAHFDSEAFINGSRRILKLKQKILNDVRDTNKDLTNARELLGKLLHTLQDFYSHSNWIEMGKTTINDRIGVNESIGSIADPNQPTCTSDGCTRITKKCTLWQLFTLRTCPIVYYDCKNNILPEINDQNLLTSGYLFNQFNENNELLNKPTNVKKCSHGSVSDDSSHIPAIGGINKDSNTLIFSPHSNLHFQAADFGVKATEQFLNGLRKDVGDDNFDRLFAINPTHTQRQNASKAIENGQRFRFFTSFISVSLKEDHSLFMEFKNWIKKRVNMIKLILNNIFSSETNFYVPTYDLSDLGVTVKDATNFRAAPYIIESESARNKRRLIHILRKRI
ncbi:unnamed protein product [Rotaria sp. Silwood1]|nr:unnamed protein product [Rotaria sp. Silwood1]